MPSTLQVGTGGSTTNLIQNGQFENPSVSGWSLVNVPSWTNTADGGTIEVWSQGYQGSPTSYSLKGVTTATGQDIELWGTNAGTISQNVTVPANTTSLQLTFEAWLRTAGSGSYDVYDLTKGQSLIGGPQTITENTSAWTGNSSALITSGFSAGDTIQVRFSPLTAGGGSSAASPHIDAVQFLATTSMYSTIQSAVNAAHSGDVIIVNPGTYQEQITINKSIELIAAHTFSCGWGYNDGSSVIEAPANLGTPTVSNPGAIIHVTGANIDVEIQGFTIEGASSTGTSNLLYGVLVEGGASADIDYNNITNIIDSSNSQLGVGISVGDTTHDGDGVGINSPASASIWGNNVTNYQRAGIVVTNVGSWAFIESNYISATSNNPADSVTGVEVSYSAAATIAYNTITNNTNDNDGSGVLLFETAQGTEVAFNCISGNDYGVFGANETGNANTSGRCSIYGGFVCGGNWGVGYYVYQCGGDWGSQCGGNFGGQGIAVDANSITGNTFNGIEFDTSTGVYISYNVVAYNGGSTLYYGDGGIYLYESTGNVINNNTTDNNYGSGIFMDVGSVGNLIVYNTSYGNFYNIVDVSADYVDETSGNGTAYTGNTWSNDSGGNSITLSGQSLTHSSKPQSFGWGW